MNIFRNPFLLIVLFCTLFLVKCTCPTGSYPDDTTLVEEISKAWKISLLTVDGNAITAGTDGFKLLLDRKGNQPTTYTIITGGLGYSFAPNTSGNWSLNDNKNPTQITFSNATVTLVSVSEDQLVIRYNEAAAPSKPEPVVQFTLVPKI